MPPHYEPPGALAAPAAWGFAWPFKEGRTRESSEDQCLLPTPRGACGNARDFKPLGLAAAAAGDDGGGSSDEETEPPPQLALERQQEVLHWLLNANCYEVNSVLNEVADTRSDLGQGQGRRKLDSVIYAEQKVAEPEPLLPNKSILDEDWVNIFVGAGRSASHYNEAMRMSSNNKLPVVQFAAGIYYCVEGEDRVELDVLRVGDASGVVQVQYETHDFSAKAGSSYEHTSGVLVFEKGEAMKTVRVAILDNDSWEPALEFKVVLKLDGLVGAVPSPYLSVARVKIIDDDVFPTNKYADEIRSGRLDAIPFLGLLVEYFKMNWRNPDVKSGSIKILLCDMVHYLYLLLRLFMNVYLIDYVLKTSVPETSLFLTGSREASLLMIMVGILAPLLWMHYVDYKKISWKVCGISRKALQLALMRKALLYDDSSRAKVRGADIVLAMVRDARVLSERGYMNLFALAQALGTLGATTLFQVLSPWVFGHEIRLRSLVPSTVFPLPLLLFLMLRRKRTHECIHERNATERTYVSYAERTVSNFRLIADYYMRPKVVEEFSNEVSDYNAAAMAVLQVMANNQYCGPWVSTAVVAVYTVFGGLSVIAGDLSLGMFVADLHVFTTMGAAWASVYNNILHMQMACPNIERMTMLLNLPIDDNSRMTISRRNRNMTLALLKEHTARDSGATVDDLPIRVKNISFGYNRAALLEELASSPDGDGEEVAMSRALQAWAKVRAGTVALLHSKRGSGGVLGKMEVPQGSLVAVVGPRGEGKSTLLKVLGGASMPVLEHRDSVFFVPSHLRVLHVPSEPYFFQGTLMDNLIFGCTGNDDDNPKRVLAICRRLTVPESIIAFVRTDVAWDWSSVLSQTQKHLLCLARALVANPEVLIVHKPTELLDQSTSMQVLQVLRDFVDKRGLEQDPLITRLRRPRTCVFTCAKAVGVEMSDMVYQVSKATGIQHLSKETVTADLMG